MLGPKSAVAVCVLVSPGGGSQPVTQVYIYRQGVPLRCHSIDMPCLVLLVLSHAFLHTQCMCMCRCKAFTHGSMYAWMPAYDCACMPACMHAGMYSHTHQCTDACMLVCMYACMYAYDHDVCMQACMHASMYSHMHTCMQACMHIRMCVCMHLHVWTCTWGHTANLHRKEASSCQCALERSSEVSTHLSLSSPTRRMSAVSLLSLMSNTTIRAASVYRWHPHPLAGAPVPLAPTHAPGSMGGTGAGADGYRWYHCSGSAIHLRP